MFGGVAEGASTPANTFSSDAVLEMPSQQQASLTAATGEADAAPFTDCGLFSGLEMAMNAEDVPPSAASNSQCSSDTTRALATSGTLEASTSSPSLTIVAVTDSAPLGSTYVSGSTAQKPSQPSEGDAANAA
jgi:hypothetical protein